MAFKQPSQETVNQTAGQVIKPSERHPLPGMVYELENVVLTQNILSKKGTKYDQVQATLKGYGGVARVFPPRTDVTPKSEAHARMIVLNFLTFVLSTGLVADEEAAQAAWEDLCEGREPDLAWQEEGENRYRLPGGFVECRNQIGADKKPNGYTELVWILEQEYHKKLEAIQKKEASENKASAPKVTAVAAAATMAAPDGDF